jgi:hypothetical protein
MNMNTIAQNATAQASDFAKVFATHATKIATAQQQWLQGQADAMKAQFEQAVANKDFAATAQSVQNNLQPAAQNLVKHAQELYALTAAAQKDLAGKAQDTYKEFASQANTAVEAGVKQLPNQGEPFVGMAKQASVAVNGAFEQVAEQIKAAQTAYEAQIAKLFEGAATAAAAVAPAAKAAAKK